MTPVVDAHVDMPADDAHVDLPIDGAGPIDKARVDAGIDKTRTDAGGVKARVDAGTSKPRVDAGIDKPRADAGIDKPRPDAGTKSAPKLGKLGDICAYGTRRRGPDDDGVGPSRPALQCEKGLICCYPCGIQGCDSVCKKTCPAVP